MTTFTDAVRVHTMDAVKVRASAVIPQDVLRSCKVTVHDMADYAAEGLLLELEAFMYGERAQHTLCVTVPSSWWQHFKEACFPAWLRKAFPVQHRQMRQTVHAARLFPHAPVPARHVGEPVLRILEVEGRNWMSA